MEVPIYLEKSRLNQFANSMKSRKSGIMYPHLAPEVFRTVQVTVRIVL
jgi:hypothetical protein